MKLLFDQNISPKIVRQLESEFPDSTQVRFIGLEDASDEIIFEYSRSNDFTIVTFDSDFVDLITLKGMPPKLIWMRTGNMTTKNISETLISCIDVIQGFLENDSDEILEIVNTP